MMNPKTATLIQERKANGAGMEGSVYTYHGNLGVLDSQEIFDNEIEDWSEMYDLDTGITGKPTVINKATISDKLKIVSNVIQFRVFCSAYRRAYVGSDGSEEDAEKKIVASVQRSQENRYEIQR